MIGFSSFFFFLFRIRKSAFLIPERTSKRGRMENGGGGGERRKGKGGVCVPAVCDSALSSVAWSRHTRALIINELMVD